MPTEFRSGSFATEMGIPRHVWFTRDSDRIADIAGGPFRAKRGLVHRSAQHIYFDHLSKAGFGSARLTWAFTLRLPPAPDPIT
jgi:hypothetical protein